MIWTTNNQTGAFAPHCAAHAMLHGLLIGGFTRALNYVVAFSHTYPSLFLLPVEWETNSVMAPKKWLAVYVLHTKQYFIHIKNHISSQKVILFITKIMFRMKKITFCIRFESRHTIRKHMDLLESLAKSGFPEDFKNDISVTSSSHWQLIFTASKQWTSKTVFRISADHYLRHSENQKKYADNGAAVGFWMLFQSWQAMKERQKDNG
jgi:hypothetical protein